MALLRSSWVKDLVEEAAKSMTDYARRLWDYVSINLTLSLHANTPAVPLPVAYQGMTWVVSNDAVRLLRQFCLDNQAQPDAAFTEDGCSGQALLYAQAILHAEAQALAQAQASADAQAYAEAQAQLHLQEQDSFEEVNDSNLAHSGMDFDFIN